jgi:hypothetical protein
MTVSEQIIQVMDALCEKLGIAINWTAENAIPYLEVLCGKLITYEIGTSIAWIVIMALMSIGSIIATKKLAPTFKRGLEEQGDWDCGWTIGTTFAIGGLVILNIASIAVVITQIMDIVKCATFPEMYIVEYVSRLLNSGT